MLSRTETDPARQLDNGQPKYVFPGIHTILGHTHIPSGRRLSSLPHMCNRPPMSFSPPADERFTARRRAFHFVVSLCVTIF